MADIVNAQIVAFCNQKCRVLADLIERTRRTSEQFAIEVAEIEALAAYSGAANGDVIIDGAAEDGRSVVTKLNIGQLKFVAEKMAEAANLDDREQLVAAWSVNGAPLF